MVCLVVVLHSLLDKPWRLLRREIRASSLCIGTTQCQNRLNKEKTIEQQLRIERERPDVEV